MDTDEVRKKLNEKLSLADVSTRQGGNGMSLSYVTGHYVISKLNEVLGQGNWSYETKTLTLVYSGQMEAYGKKTYTAHYIAYVVLSGRIGAATFSFGDYGYGDGTDKSNPGKPFELAVKEAVTDGLKRCAKNLGPVLGLALYEKEQNDVTDEKTVCAGTNVASAPQNAVATNTNPDPTEGKHYETAKEKIKKAAHELVKSQKLTAETFKKSYLAGKRVDDLQDGEAAALFIRLGLLYPEIKLLQ